MYWAGMLGIVFLEVVCWIEGRVGAESGVGCLEGVCFGGCSACIWVGGVE